MPGKLVSPSQMPSIVELRESELPQIKDWKLGGHYKIVLEVEQVSHDKGYDGSDPARARFKILSAKSAGESKAPPPKQSLSKAAKLSAMAEKADE